MEQSLAKDKLMIVRSFDVWWADQATRLQVRNAPYSKCNFLHFFFISD